jgi:hypothetical protein
MRPIVTFPLGIFQPRNTILIEEIDIINEIFFLMALILMVILYNLLNFLNIHVGFLMRAHWYILEVINNVLLIPLRLFEAAFFRWATFDHLEELSFSVFDILFLLKLVKTIVAHIF